MGAEAGEQMHSAYCVEGLADDRFNGEYALMLTLADDAVADANGQWAFEKNSFDGAAFLSRKVEAELLSLALGAVAVAFVMGMTACLCCFVCLKRTPYKHLGDDDVDSDASDVEI